MSKFPLHPCGDNKMEALKRVVRIIDGNAAAIYAPDVLLDIPIMLDYIKDNYKEVQHISFQDAAISADFFSKCCYSAEIPIDESSDSDLIKDALTKFVEDSFGLSLLDFIGLGDPDVEFLL
jgi:hypothetical protein